MMLLWLFSQTKWKEKINKINLCQTERNAKQFLNEKFLIAFWLVLFSNIGNLEASIFYFDANFNLNKYVHSHTSTPAHKQTHTHEQTIRTHAVTADSVIKTKH